MPWLEEELRQISAEWEYVVGQSENAFSLQFSKESLIVIAEIPENYHHDPIVIDLKGSDWEKMREERQGKIFQDINEYSKVCNGQQAMLTKILEETWIMTRPDASVAHNECRKSNQSSKRKKKTKYRKVFEISLRPNISSSANTKNTHDHRDDFGNKGSSNKKKGQKSPSMKTAKDVINRLQQDEQLKDENFVVEYQDRSNRPIKVPVSSIMWEDNMFRDSVKNISFSEYCIQQFMWDSKIIWDKITQSDNVFGSGLFQTGDDLVKFIKRHKTQRQYEAYKIHLASHKMPKTAVEQKPDKPEASMKNEHSIKPKSGNCLVYALNNNCKSTNAESGLNNKNPVDSKLDPVNPEVDVKEDIEPVDSYSESNTSSKNVVIIKGGMDQTNGTPCPLADEVDGEKFESSSSHGHDNFEFKDEAILSTVTHENLKQEDKICVDNNTDCTKNMKGNKLEPDSDEENSLLLTCLSDEEEKISDSISCPKDGTSNQKRLQHKYQPYHDYSKENRVINRSKRIDREKNEKRHEVDNESRNEGSEEMRSRYRYCIAVDVGKSEISQLQRLQSRILHSHKSHARLRREEYFFISVAEVTFDNAEEKRGVNELLNRICDDLEAFKSSIQSVMLQGRMIVGTVDEAFQNFSTRFSKEKPSNVNITCNPHIPLLQVRGDSWGLENKKFPNLDLKIFVRYMYLWNLDDGDDQHVHHVYLQNNKSPSLEEQHHHKRHDSRPSFGNAGHKNSKWEYTVSKGLSGILRHNDKNFTVDKKGYLDVNSIIQHQFFKRLHVTESDIEKIVETNSKKRFALEGSPGSYRIRATQGHSVKYVDLNLRKLEDPDEFTNVIHGTMYKFYESISRHGLKRMKRNHIHMTTGLPRDETQVISGMRNTSDCFIYVNVRKAMGDGIEFFVSENGVILSDGVDGILDAKYFQKVVHRRGGHDHELPSLHQDKTALPEPGSNR